MAKLGSYYSLCPLIDHRSLLGISEDEENGIVIVTLGKNIAIKYKLSDQKQIHSWRTKEKFSSPIIFDKTLSQYVAVFNHSYIRTWAGNEEVIDKLKKLKFTQQIYTLFSCADRNFVLFQNGAVRSLSEAIENRKGVVVDDVIDTNKEYIVEILHCLVNTVTYIGLVVKSEDCDYLYWSKFNNDATKFSKILLNRPGFELTGYVFHIDKNSANFLNLWSDGRVYSLELKDADLELSSPGDLFTVIEPISCKEPVSVVSLDENYIAFYGCNCNDEGALLIVYNAQFKVTQSKASFKLFTKGAKLWRIQENLLLPVGQHLAVVPFYLDTEQLAALVGSHKIADPDISIVQNVQEVSWNSAKKLQKNAVSRELSIKISDLANQGLGESLIFEQILSDSEEKLDLAVLAQALEYFSDISEKCLCKLLKLILKSEVKKSKFEALPLEKQNVINLVFTKPFSEVLLLSHLRLELDLDQALLLLRYICFLLNESDCSVEIESKLIQWGSAILDANYQRFLLSRDDQILEVLRTFSEFVREELQCLEDISGVVPLLVEMKNGRSVQKSMHIASLSYSIEEMSLY